MEGRKVGRVVLLLGVALLAGCGGARLRGTVLEPPFPAPDFTLTDQHGQPFTLSEQQGKVVVLFFGYTNCPDICPTTMATWREVHDSLGADAGRVRFVFVTVDPERDTPERMAEYVNLFSADFVALTGTADELGAVYKAYGVFHEKQAMAHGMEGYGVAHTSTTFIVDPKGQWRVNEAYGTPTEDVTNDVRALFN